MWGIECQKLCFYVDFLCLFLIEILGMYYIIVGSYIFNTSSIQIIGNIPGSTEESIETELYFGNSILNCILLAPFKAAPVFYNKMKNIIFPIL